MRQLKRVWCWIVGHRGYGDEHPFSQRMGLCARCGCRERKL